MIMSITLFYNLMFPLKRTLHVTWSQFNFFDCGVATHFFMSLGWNMGFCDKRQKFSRDWSSKNALGIPGGTSRTGTSRFNRNPLMNGGGDRLTIPKCQ
jgi:hypothetical protein